MNIKSILSLFLGALIFNLTSCKKQEQPAPTPQKKWTECVCIYTNYAYNPVTNTHWSEKDTSILQIEEGEDCRSKNTYILEGPYGSRRTECELK